MTSFIYGIGNGFGDGGMGGNGGLGGPKPR